MSDDPSFLDIFFLQQDEKRKDILHQTPLAAQGRAIKKENGKQRGSLRAAEGQILSRRQGRPGQARAGKSKAITRLWIRRRQRYPIAIALAEKKDVMTQGRLFASV